MTESRHEDRSIELLETQDWLDSLTDVLMLRGRERAGRLVRDLQIAAARERVSFAGTAQTPYVNTIPAELQPAYPGNLKIERRIAALVRWNAMAMVVRANRHTSGIGGHLSTYASIAALYEVGYHHFFRGAEHPDGPDMIYFQGHATPGNYARAFLEGRLIETQLENFRRERAEGGGLSSYPHPWLMPEFWQFPTVSMGLGPIMAIYQARFMRYLEDRGLVPQTGRKVWCFVGDGETDEPETLAALDIAAREKLDNLIFVVNCNLQRLDGPVRGNGKIIQELEGRFRGADWNVIKVVWGSAWDELLARDHEGRLVRLMGETLDGEYQKHAVEDGAYIREHFFGRDPALLEMVKDKSDDELHHMRFGGHDPVKVHAAYHRAVRAEGRPTVVLAKTIKGYGLGEAGEGHNVTHKRKKLEADELLEFRSRFNVPVDAKDADEAPFLRFDDDSPEQRYLLERRRELGGFLPERRSPKCTVALPGGDLFEEFYEGNERPVSTTMAFGRMLTKLLKDKEFGPRVVPIIPDEARTFGIESLFHTAGIYSSVGQLYEPVDAESLLSYDEKKDGQVLEEGITEAGAISSFIAAGTAHNNHELCMVPVFMFYSMFGFQRIGDLMWAAGDIRARGFLLGCISGRTSLTGEGLQHQDGQSHVLALSVPNLLCYDPAFAFEVAAVLREGLRRMVKENEDIFYYMTIGNQTYAQPPMPEGAEEGILKGLYLFRPAEKTGGKVRVQLLGSGQVMTDVLKAREVLAEKFDIHADVWSAPSYKALHYEAVAAERWNRLHPGEKPRTPYVAECLSGAPGPIVAASDYLRTLPQLISAHVDKRVCALGTDGFGRSEDLAGLRDYFEVDHRHIVLAALGELLREEKVEAKLVKQAMKEFEIDPEKPNPVTQ